jgi:hypothetical protein
MTRALAKARSSDIDCDMPRITRPSFRPIPTAEVSRSLDALKEKAEAAQVGDQLDLDKLEADVKGDAALEGHVRVLRDAVAAQANAGEPLDAATTRTVLNALIAAKTDVEKVDADRSGALEEGELKNAEPLYTGPLAARLAHAAVDAATATFQAEMNAWREARSRFLEKRDTRQRLDHLLRDRAAFHCETPTGREAVIWLYRGALLDGMDGFVEEMEEHLRGAELDTAGLLAIVPLFTPPAERKGHLNDAEVSRMLVADDLEEFTSLIKGDILAKVGGDWDAFLRGDDIAVDDDVSDG